MMKSPYRLEYDLGMRFYASDTPGIGGVLRQEPEDFRVDEMSADPKPDEKGRYLICRLKKRNWDHHRAIKAIAKQLGISHRRISWGGTKDKNAVTSQVISIYDVDASDLELIRLRDISLDPIYRSHQQVSLGELRGNIFTIRIRDTGQDSIDERLSAITEKVLEGIPNYYGIQRFGAVRPVTHLVGLEILKGNLGDAVRMYIGEPFEEESTEMKSAREAFLESGDAKSALFDFPVYMRYERAMLNHLAFAPDDYNGALKTLPPKLLSMFVSAYQSWQFNRVVSMRIEEGIPLGEPVEGDRLIFANGREDIVTPAAVRTAALHIRRGRCSVALHLPGAETGEPVGMMDDWMAGLLSEDGITPESFRKASGFVDTRFYGANRVIALKTDISAECVDNIVDLRFSLQPGQYATTVCREYMKADPLRMI